MPNCERGGPTCFPLPYWLLVIVMTLRASRCSTHYVVVNDDDGPLFEPYRSENRLIIAVSRYLPRWLWATSPQSSYPADDFSVMHLCGTKTVFRT